VATYRKMCNKKAVKWRAEIARNGTRQSAVFATKRAAEKWAIQIEAEIDAGKRGIFPRKTLAEAMQKYADEVSPTKDGTKWECDRLSAFQRQFPQLATMVISDIRTPHMLEWRKARAKVVTEATIRRDKNLLSNVFTVARDQWHWCGESPFKGLASFEDSEDRERRVKPDEVRRICRWLGYRTGQVQTAYQQVALAFLIGLRTGMRAGEILRLGPSCVDLTARVATFRKHKTRRRTRKPRRVPLTKRGMRLVNYIPRGGFTIDGEMLSALFRKATGALMIEDLHFHDSRGEFLTRYSRKVDVLTLSKISGHKDIRVLHRRYYRESAADIAARLP